MILPAMLVALLLLMGMESVALPTLGNCKVETNEFSGLTRTVCNMGELVPYSNFKASGGDFKPAHLIRTVRPIGSYAIQRVELPSTVKVGAEASLRNRLCPDGRTPVVGISPNPERSAARIVQCLPPNAIVGQEGPTFIQSNTRMARWAELRDPYIYTQKQNRPFSKNY